MSKIDPDYEIFVNIQSRLADVIFELESDLLDLRENNYTKQESIDSKNNQIEELIQFNNDIEQILKLAKLQIININVTRRQVESFTESILNQMDSTVELIIHITKLYNDSGQNRGK